MGESGGRERRERGGRGKEGGRERERERKIVLEQSRRLVVQGIALFFLAILSILINLQLAPNPMHS